MIDSKFLYAGKASFVIRNPKNESVTVKYSKAKAKVNYRTGQPWPETFFMSLRHGNGAWVYVGRMARTARTVSRATLLPATLDRPIKVAEWAIKVLNGEATLPAGYTIEHTGRCGVCYKLLRDPVSIALGIGPVCQDKY